MKTKHNFSRKVEIKRLDINIQKQRVALKSAQIGAWKCNFLEIMSDRTNNNQTDMRAHLEVTLRKIYI